MKALTIQQYGGSDQLQITEVAIPTIGKGEVLVRVHAAGINPVDYKIRNGSMKIITGKKFPRILGGDISGVVEQSGEKSIYRPGDKVYGMLTLKGGGYAEFVAVHEDQICFIPDNLSFIEAGATPLASLTALQALHKGEPIKKGDRVLINGASGGVGSFAVQIAKSLGAYVVAVCSAQNSEMVYNLGADEVIDYNKVDFTKTTTKYEKIIDAVAKSSFGKCRKILTNDGSYISTIPNGALIFQQTFNFLRSKKSFSMMAKPLAKDLKIISGLIESDQLRPHIEKVFPLEEGSKAHQMIETERVKGKIVLSVIPES